MITSLKAAVRAKSQDYHRNRRRSNIDDPTWADVARLLGHIVATVVLLLAVVIAAWMVLAPYRHTDSRAPNGIHSNMMLSR